MNRGSYLPESPSTYWRWGLPSLVLAAVTLVLMGLSQWVIEPRIASRYSQLVDGVLGSSQSTTEMLRRGDLAAQRLMVLFPEDARQRRLHAELCFKIAAETLRLDQSPEMASAYRNRGLASLRSATRMGGPDSLWAKNWLLRDDLVIGRQTANIDESSARELFERIDTLSRESPDNATQWYAAMVRIQLGHRITPELDSSARESQLRQGIEALESFLGRQKEKPAGLDSLIASAWLAEGLASLAPEQAALIARDTVIGYAGRIQELVFDLSIARRIEAIDAVFRCLLLVSGSEEASNSVLSRLEEIPDQDRRLLRNVVVSSYLRALVSRTTSLQSAYSDLSIGGVLTSALRIGPEHPALCALLDSYLLDQPQLAGSLGGIFPAGDSKIQDRFLSKLAWVKSVLDQAPQSDSASSDPLPEWGERDKQIAIGLMAYWIGAVRRRTVEWERIEPILARLVDAYPSSSDLRLGRAIAASTLGRWEIAKEDLEVVSKSNPGNELIEKMLVKANQNIAPSARRDSK